MRSPARRGFTLIEMLIVVLIIGILIAMLLPAVQHAREAARRTGCKSNLMQLWLGVQNYESAFRRYPAGVVDPASPIRNVAAGHHHGWIARILPYIEQQNAFEQIDFGVSVYDPRNATAREAIVQVLACPADPSFLGIPGGPGPTNYAACHHDLEAPIAETNNGVFTLNRFFRRDQIDDGLTSTIFLGEKTIEQYDLGWISGTRTSLRNTGTAINQTAIGGRNWIGVPIAEALTDTSDPTAPKGTPLGAQLYVGGFGSDHPNGANFAFGDGSIRFLTEQISTTVYQRLGHRADGALLSADAY